MTKKKIAFWTVCVLFILLSFAYRLFFSSTHDFAAADKCLENSDYQNALKYINSFKKKKKIEIYIYPINWFDQSYSLKQKQLNRIYDYFMARYYNSKGCSEKDEERCLYNLNKSMKYLGNCLRNSPEKENLFFKEQISNVNNNIGRLYLNQDKFELAIKYFLLAMENAGSDNESLINGDIALTYNSIAIKHFNASKYSKSIEFLKKALKYKKFLKNSDLSFIYTNLGRTHYRKGNYKKSIEIFKKAYDSKPNQDILDSIGLNYIMLSVLNSKKKYYKNSIKYYKEGDIVKSCV